MAQPGVVQTQPQEAQLVGQPGGYQPQYVNQPAPAAQTQNESDAWVYWVALFGGFCIPFVWPVLFCATRSAPKGQKDRRFAGNIGCSLFIVEILCVVAWIVLTIFVFGIKPEDWMPTPGPPPPQLM